MWYVLNPAPSTAICRRRVPIERSGGLSEHDAALREALEKAIYREIGARNFYGTIAETIENPAGAARFRHLSEDEDSHREKLVSWMETKTGVRFEPDPDRLRESEISGVELSGKTGAFEALRIAIEAETKAEAHYREQAALAADPDLKTLLSDIAEEESGHRTFLEAELNSLRGEFYWFDFDSSSPLED